MLIQKLKVGTRMQCLRKVLRFQGQGSSQQFGRSHKHYSVITCGSERSDINSFNARKVEGDSDLF